VNPDSDPPLPRSPDDAENLRRLRENARRELEREERPYPAAVYGGPPPAPVYGGPPQFGGAPVTRRWTLKGILLLLGGIIGGLVALWFGARRYVAPVYGGPPIQPPNPPAPVYGGPPPPNPEPPNPAPSNPGWTQPAPSPQPNPAPNPPAPVYGGPPPSQ
jgi:hypothetical protein